MEAVETNVSDKIKNLTPPLTRESHKGQAGKIGVFGGSLDYTGAPYFSAISSLKVGADLVYVFTTKSAAPVIKSYSPELIVHPYLDDEKYEEKIQPWIQKIHVAVIGPGLGRADSTFEVMKTIIRLCKNRNIPLVIDADGLFFIAKDREILRDYPTQVILTPNHVEFGRLVGDNGDGEKLARAKPILDICPRLTLVCKGKEDEIFNNAKLTRVTSGGSARRCGGQGDLLSGSLGTFLHWALQNNEFTDDEKPLVAAYGACMLTRECNSEGFKKKGRSLLCTDMIEEIHNVFEKSFEPESCNA